MVNSWRLEEAKYLLLQMAIAGSRQMWIRVLVLDPKEVQYTQFIQHELYTDGSDYYNLMTYTKVRGNTDLEWIPQVSNDLVNWTDTDTVIVNEVIQNNTITISVRDVFKIEAGQPRFIRLKINKIH